MPTPPREDVTPQQLFFAARDALRTESSRRLALSRELATTERQASEALLCAIEALETVEFTAGALLREAPEASRESLRLAARGVRETLARSGLCFDGSPGEPLDLSRHKVARRSAGTQAKAETVLSVLRHGVVYRGTRLRPASVVASVVEEGR